MSHSSEFNSIANFCNEPTAKDDDDRTMLVAKVFTDLGDGIKNGSNSNGPWKKATMECVDGFGTPFLVVLFNDDVDDCVKFSVPGSSYPNPFRAGAWFCSLFHK